MTRKRREWYKGASYHVMGRGNRRCPIFEGMDDYYIFMKILEQTKKQYPFTLHSFCLMTNHFHLELTTADTEIWNIMHMLLGNYAKTFNRVHKQKGHLFESRYMSPMIRDERYFLEVSRYIHLNPVKAGIVRNPIDYPYSSYKYYISGAYGRIGEMLDVSRILTSFDDPPRDAYRSFVEGKSSHDEQEKMIREDIKEDDDWGALAGEMWSA